MSQKIKERTEELAKREQAIKGKLLGKSGSLKSKANRIGKTALIGGGITLVIYMIYKAFFTESKPSKKIKGSHSNSGVVTEKLVSFLLPYLGKILDRFFDKGDTAPIKEEGDSESKD